MLGSRVRASLLFYDFLLARPCKRDFQCSRLLRKFRSKSPNKKGQSNEKPLWNIVSEGFSFVVGWYRSDFVEPLPDIARTSKCPSEYPPWKYIHIDKCIQIVWENQTAHLLILLYLSSAVIVYHCLSNIWAVFEPQFRKVFIINNFYILHWQVTNAL